MPSTAHLKNVLSFIFCSLNNFKISEKVVAELTYVRTWLHGTGWKKYINFESYPFLYFKSRGIFIFKYCEIKEGHS